MASSFPGVDPYLENSGLWPDFHAEFIGCWRSALLEKLPAGYDARLDERPEHRYLEDEIERVIVPDVTIEQRSDSAGFSDAGQEGGVPVHTATLPLPQTFEMRETCIKILRRDDRSLVAVLELLSPTNKGAERAVYLQKRDELIASAVHLVEVDLLLGGRRLPMGRPLPAGNYFALISRGDRRPNSDVYTWSIRDRIPAIPIPLAQPDESVTIDLQQVFETAWQRGAYDRAVDYDLPLELPLPDEDRAWLESQKND